MRHTVLPPACDVGFCVQLERSAGRCGSIALTANRRLALSVRFAQHYLIVCRPYGRRRKTLRHSGQKTSLRDFRPYGQPRRAVNRATTATPGRVERRCLRDQNRRTASIAADRRPASFSAADVFLSPRLCAGSRCRATIRRRARGLPSAIIAGPYYQGQRVRACAPRRGGRVTPCPKTCG